MVISITSNKYLHGNEDIYFQGNEKYDKNINQ